MQENCTLKGLQWDSSAHAARTPTAVAEEFGKSLQWQQYRFMAVQADRMSGAPAASAAAAKKEEEAKEGEGKDSEKPQSKGGAWWQWLLVRN